MIYNIDKLLMLFKNLSAKIFFQKKFIVSKNVVFLHRNSK